MRAFLPFCFLIATLFLTGCTDSWLVGKWEVDREATMAAFNAAQGQADQKKEGGSGFLGEIIGGVQKGISRMLVAAMEDTTVEFTSSEFRRISDGSGVAQTYEIIDRPSAGVRVVKFASGEISTWAKAGSGIKRQLSEDQDLWIYFSRAK